jgi:hypothetical protein
MYIRASRYVDCMSGAKELERDAAELSRQLLALALSAVPGSTGRSYTLATYYCTFRVLGAMVCRTWGS